MQTETIDMQLNLLESSLLKVLDATPVPIIVSNLDGSFKYVNSALLDMLGYSANEVYSTDIIISHPDDYESNRKVRDQLEQSPLEPVTIEKRYLHKNGKVIDALLTMVAEENRDGSIKHFIAQIVDITERKAYQKDISLFRALVDKSIDGMVVVSPDSGLIISANQRFCKNLGYSLEELQEMTVKDIELNLEDSFSWAKYVKSVKEKGNKIIEGTHCRKDGTQIPVEISVSYVKLNDSDYMLAIVRDISDRRKKDEMIWFQANYDALTRLPNRYMFRDRLDQEMKKAKRANKKVAVFCIDIDNFKDVNDSFGHDHGDKLLIEMAHRLQACIRGSDTVARLGGDEFAIIISDISDVEYIDRIAGKVVETLAEPVNLDMKKVFVSASTGIVIYPDDGKTTDDLLKDADHAMYEVKRSGRNGYRYFTPKMHEEAVKRIDLINDLHKALDEHQFEMVYQPIFDVNSLAIKKAEALVRWHHPEKGLINPDDFIPAAEESGLIIDIGCWVFNSVTQQMKQWKELYGTDIQININMSPIQFNDKDDKILYSWLASLKRYNLAGENFTIEITENAMMKTQGEEGIDEKIQLLRNNGVRIALDDFGTGCSSLAHLKKLEIDFIKIDRSFVTRLQKGSDNMALCEAIITMASKLNLEVVAEGVETEEEYQLLKSIGCRYGQGYLFARPLKVDTFTNLFIKKD